MHRIICLLLIPLVSSIAGTKIEVEVGGVGSSSCPEAPSAALLTTSIMMISVIVMPTGDAPNKDETFTHDRSPEWLKLEFGYASASANEFESSPDLQQILIPNYYVSNYASIVPIENWVYKYTVLIPETLADQEICIRAVASPAPYGTVVERLDQNNQPAKCIRIAGICSPDDRNRALSSHIRAAKKSGNFQRAIQLADSLVATGWRTDEGLYVALTCARKQKDYVSELRFMDLMYETYGYIDILEGPPTLLARERFDERRETVFRKSQEQQR